MLLFYPVAAAAFLPDVFLHLPQAVGASPADHQLSGFQQIRRDADTGQHIILCLQYPPALPPQQFQKAGRRRIHDHCRDRPVSRQLFQFCGILPVGHLPLLLPGIKVELLHPVPDPAASAPEPHGHGIHRAVIAGNVPFVAACRHLPHQFLCEEIVDSALRLDPLSQHIPPIEYAGVQPLIPGPDLRCQGGIVLHGKMQTQAVPHLCLPDPFHVQPVIWSCRIAIEPKPASCHAAPCTGLLHKGPGHQGRFIQQHSCKGDALDQGRRAFIPAAEEIKPVPVAQKIHRQQILRPVLPIPHSQIFQLGQHFPEHIAPQ